MSRPDLARNNEMIKSRADHLFAPLVIGLANAEINFNSLPLSNQLLEKIMWGLDATAGGAVLGVTGAVFNRLWQNYHNPQLRPRRFDPGYEDHLERDMLRGGLIGGGLGLLSFGIVTALQSGIIH